MVKFLKENIIFIGSSIFFVALFAFVSEAGKITDPSQVALAEATSTAVEVSSIPAVATAESQKAPSAATQTTKVKSAGAVTTAISNPTSSSAVNTINTQVRRHSGDDGEENEGSDD